MFMSNAMQSNLQSIIFNLTGQEDYHIIPLQPYRSHPLTLENTQHDVSRNLNKMTLNHCSQDSSIISPRHLNQTVKKISSFHTTLFRVTTKDERLYCAPRTNRSPRLHPGQLANWPL